MKGDPLVSIRCTVYNHEPFLRQCLDGFVMQQTTFPFEAIVHDDASTDGSAAIIREYAERYPDIIKPIYETENQYSKHDGSLGRIMDAAIHPAARYIATCEGDDYWTDPHKLQLQVDFLESHPDYVVSSHDYSTYRENDQTTEVGQDRFKYLSSEFFNGEQYHTFSLDDYYNIWFLQTLCTVRRNIQYIEDEKRQKYTNYQDHINFYYILKKGKCVFFKRNMATYRIHSGGVRSGCSVIKWNNDYLESSYVLYRLENEKRLVPDMNRSLVELFINYLYQRDFRIALKTLCRHKTNTSTWNSIVCMFKIIAWPLEIIYKKVTKKI